MDMVEFQEKMDPTHRVSLCRMLNVEQLPECLLREYIKAKIMVDRIDGFLTVGELAILALASGYLPDTRKFFPMTTEGEDARLQAEADDMAVKPPDDQLKNVPRVTPLTVAQAADKEVEKILEPPVEEPTMTGEQAAEAVASGAKPVEAAVPDEGKAMLWAHGMPVKVLTDDELKQGKIVGINHPELGSGKKVQLTVEFEGGETVTVDEDEVEAI